MPVLDTKKDLSALFSLQVQATPDAIALEDDKTTYTYAELDQKVEDLAHALRSHGVKRDSLVGVLLPRSADYIIACLAALRAGGAFLVLELAYPPELLTDVLEDATPVVVVTYRAEVGKFKEGMAPPPVETDLDRLAFVAYSSGTTGKPKGIANPHRASVNSYDLRFGLSDLQPGDRVAANVFFIVRISCPRVRLAADTDFDIVGNPPPTAPWCHRDSSLG
jgi:non-ribosomal peptide synthetase component F